MVVKYEVNLENFKDYTKEYTLIIKHQIKKSITRELILYISLFTFITALLYENHYKFEVSYFIIVFAVLILIVIFKKLKEKILIYKLSSLKNDYLNLIHTLHFDEDYMSYNHEIIKYNQIRYIKKTENYIALIYKKYQLLLIFNKKELDITQIESLIQQKIALKL